MIQLLDAATSNRIAAGEVVERPASIVKELCENALDAKATAISIEIVGGGIDRIRIADNGVGMSAQDLELCLLRHATSKIRSGDPLTDIPFLGFRGEALPSIAAVSRLTITSRPRGGEIGMRLTCEGGGQAHIEPVGCPEGTSVLVEDLFFNTPARRAFLRRPATEAASVSEVVLAMLLGHPDRSIKLTNQGKVVYASPGDGKLRSAIRCAWGAEAAGGMIAVDGERDGVRASGYVGVAQMARGNRAGQLFFVNGRAIRSQVLQQALEYACAERVTTGRFPTAALHIALAYADVDVNVHPNKLEVRFRDEEAVRRAVVDVVRESLFEAARTSRDDLFVGGARGDAGRPSDGGDRARPVAGTRRETSVGATTGATARAMGDAKPTSAGEAREGDARERFAGRGPSDAGVSMRDGEMASGMAGGEAAQGRTGNSCDRSSEAATQGSRTGVTHDPSRGAATQGNPSGDAIRHNPSRDAATHESLSGDATLHPPSTGATPAHMPPSEAAEMRDLRAATQQPAQGASIAQTPGADASAAPGDRTAQPDAAAPTARASAAPPTLSLRETYVLPVPQTALEPLPSFLPETAPLAPSDVPNYELLGVFQTTYLIVSAGGALYCIDQHAAHERILYDAFLRAYDAGRISQPLLVPIVLRLSLRERATVLENADLFEQLGFDIEEVGDGVFLRAVPHILGAPQAQDFFRELLDRADDLRSSRPIEHRRDVIIKLACRKAIKAGDALSDAEMHALVRRMLDGDVLTCPHGRPVYLRLTLHELEKRFGRA